MNRITILSSFIFLCSLLNAQNCDPEDLSLEGLRHYEKAEMYRINLPKGTHEQYIEELEAVLRTDSLWLCSIIYKQLGWACEYMYTNKKHTKKKEYLSKSILYYKKYQELERSDKEIIKKIANLEAELDVLRGTINDSIKIEMIFVEGMLNEDTTACLHSFYIGKYEVTQRQWQLVMGGANPSHFKGPNLPVEQIESEYQLFLSELNRITGSHYRTPTFIEWFYAARGGKNKENYAYSGSFAENKVAWFSSNSGNRTHAVGEKEPNSLGIYDMSGNVSEICLAEYYLYSWGYKTNEKRALGGDFNSKPFMIMDSQLEKNSNNAFSSFYDLKIVEEYNKIESDFKGYHVGNANNKNIGLRLVLDVDYNSMSAEEQLWDTWIKQKKDRLQNEEEKKLKRAKRRDFFWGVGHRWGIKIDYNFNGYGQIGRDDVFVNKLFSHTMLGLNFRIPIGDYFYIEPQIKAGIESDWKTASEQKGFFNQLSTCFDNVQLIHLEIPLIVGGIYITDNIAFRGYTAGQFCPIIQTKYNNIDINTKPYFALLFGFGFDLGNSITADLYYRKPITNETRLTTQGFTASIGFLF